MKYLKMLGFATLALMALIAFVGAGTVSATTLEVGGTTRNESVTVTMSLKAGSGMRVESTIGIVSNACTSSHAAGATEKPYTGTNVTGGLVQLTFTSCYDTFTVDNVGQLYIQWTSGTNALVYSENAEITTYSGIHGTHINCKTGAGTLLGTLTGFASGHAELHVNAVVGCGNEHMASARWTATYIVTSPTALGVSA